MKKKLPIKKLMLGTYLISLSFSQAIAQCASPTNVYAFTYNGKNYGLIKEKKTWEQAATCAVEQGGQLVQIDSLGEQMAIYNAIVASGVPNNYNPVNDGGGTSYIWIGATDKANEGTWIWDGDNNNVGVNFWNGQGANGTNNGTVVLGKYVNWGGKSTGTVKEPDNYNDNQDAAAIGLTGWPAGSTDLGVAGEWNDIAITNTLYYIIEYEQTSKVKEFTATNFLSIYPNPSGERITITTIKPLTNAYLRILTITGQLIFEKTNLAGNRFDTSVSELTNGIYIVELIQNDTTYRSKFVKN